MAAVLSPQLWRSIDFSSCHQRRGLTNDEIVTIVSRFGSGVAERLNLRGLEVDDETLIRLAALLAGGPLRSIDLGACSCLSGRAITSLGSISTLEELGIESVAGFEDAHLASLCLSCPRLTRLDARYCEWLTDASALLGPNGSRPWSVLQLDGCFRLDVERLIAGRSGVWQSLRELSVDGEDLPSDQFLAIAECCPSLRHLAVSFARDLESRGLRALSSLPWLEHLALKKGTLPPDASWAALFSRQHASRIAKDPAAARRGAWRALSFAECELFADGAAASLAAAAQPLLLELDLSWCWHLTDVGLRLVLGAAPGLQRLRLAGIKGVTGGGLVPCCRMSGLEELDCTSCNSVQDQVLEFLHRLFAAAPGEGRDGLPEELPPRVASVARGLWAQRRSKRGRRSPARLRIKNYYAEYLEDWAQLQPPQDVCAAVEALLSGLGQSG